MPASSHLVLASSGSFLITPGLGLMVWTLVIFTATMLLLAGKDLSSTWRSLRRQPATRALQSEAESLSGAP